MAKQKVWEDEKREYVFGVFRKRPNAAEIQRREERALSLGLSLAARKRLGISEDDLVLAPRQAAIAYRYI